MNIIIFIIGTIVGAFLMAIVSGRKYTELENRYNQHLTKLKEKRCSAEQTNTSAK